MKKIRILVSSNSGLRKMEGIATILHDYFERFDKDRFAVSMIAEGEIAPEARDAFIQAGIQLVPAPNRKKDTIHYLRFLKQAVRDYDIFYINGSSAILALDLMAAKAGNIPIRVVESHNTCTSHAWMDKLLRPLFYASYTDAFACGQDAGKWLFGRRPFTLLKNGRSPQTYAFSGQQRQRMRKQLGLSDETLVFGHVGNLNPIKNQSHLIEAFAKVKEIHPDVHLFLIGAGQSEQAFRDQIHTLGLDEHVTLTGKVTNVPDYLQAMDVMCLPSLFEGLPLVAVEWQMAGLPVLISDTVTKECGFTDLLHYLPLSAGTQVWANQLLELAQNRPDRQTASQKGVEQARAAGFDIDQNAVDLQKTFEQMVQRAGRI